MPDRWVVDPEHPGGHLVAMTAAEEKQRAADQAAAQKREEAEQRAADTVAARRARIDDLADKLEDDTATDGERSELLALVARTLVE